MEDLEDLNLQAIVEGQDYEKQLNRLVSMNFNYYLTFNKGIRMRNVYIKM